MRPEHKRYIMDTIVEGDYTLSVERDGIKVHRAWVTRVKEEDGKEVVSLLWIDGEFAVYLWDDEKHMNGKQIRMFKDYSEVHMITRGAGKVTQLPKVDMNKNAVVSFLETQGVPNPKDKWKDYEKMKSIIDDNI